MMATPNFERTSSFDGGDQLEMVSIDQEPVESLYSLIWDFFGILKQLQI